ncbi:MAG: hypothetical protein IJB04_01220, partial [Oscillospiraceae bacterium]|nr:hypothetical protein [Oscillospiraceae bacterium]
MNYIVMECHPGYAVLLDEDGRFIKAANFQYEVGDTVTDPVPMRETRPRHRRRASPWAYAAGALAACLTLVLGLLIYQLYFYPVSSIIMNINPQVRMELNSHGDVLALQGLNEDGVTLLQGYSGRGKDSLTVSDELIDRAIAMGFLSEGGEVIFSILAPDEARFQQYGLMLRHGVSDYLTDRLSVTVEIYDGHVVIITPDGSISSGNDADIDDDDTDDDDNDDDND